MRLDRSVPVLLAMTWLLMGQGANCGDPPPVDREFRAAWVATVANIDWPSRPGLTAEAQRGEMIALLDAAQTIGLNALVFQVRPAADAIYQSDLEPWSEFLTGAQGRAPDDGYDPLTFVCEQAHRRGIELHAWFNPYRASHPSGKTGPSPDHVSQRHPEWVKKYGVYDWLDPSDPGAMEYNISVILDVVRRYDVDAVHFDDYFFPYPINDADGNEVPFPDQESWERYLENTPAADRLERDDWRRANVNLLMERLATEIKQVKPWVRFSISPFGIYRPGQPETIQGFDAYAKLYADSKLWIEQGWVDYLSPQLYWPIDQKPQSFPVLLDWWREHNPHARHIWPGLFTSKILADGKGWSPDEIVNQIEITRSRSDAPGHVHFSMKALQQNRSGVADRLREGIYRQPALPPATPWCVLPEGEDLSQSRPEVSVEGGKIEWRLAGDAAPRWWTVQVLADGEWSTHVMPGGVSSIDLKPSQRRPERVVVRAVDRLGQASQPAEVTSSHLVH